MPLDIFLGSCIFIDFSVVSRRAAVGAVFFSLSLSLFHRLFLLLPPTAPSWNQLVNTESGSFFYYILVAAVVQKKKKLRK